MTAHVLVLQDYRPAMTPSPSQGALLEKIDQVGEKAEEDHRRLREDVNGIGSKVASLQTVQTDLLLRLQKLELTPMGVERVSFTSVQLIAIVIASLSLAAGMWQLHVGINEVQAAVANTAKLQDERNQTQKDALDNLGRQIEMRRVEIQRVRDDLADYVKQQQQKKEPR